MAFTDRPADRHIVFTGNHTSGTQIKHWIADGDRVEVCLGDNFVSVVDVKTLGNSKYRGRVQGFLNSPENAIGEIAIDAIVEFEERHVSSCDAG